MIKRSRLNKELHNKQIDGMIETLNRMSEINRNPFKALLDCVAKDSDGIDDSVVSLRSVIGRQSPHGYIHGRHFFTLIVYLHSQGILGVKLWRSWMLPWQLLNFNSLLILWLRAFCRSFPDQIQSQ